MAPSDAANVRGEAYLVDSAVTSSLGATSDKIALSASPTFTSGATIWCYVHGAGTAATQTVNVTGTTGLANWVSLPGAIAVYHTIIGD